MAADFVPMVSSSSIAGAVAVRLDGLDSDRCMMPSATDTKASNPMLAIYGNASWAIERVSTMMIPEVISEGYARYRYRLDPLKVIGRTDV